jgi:hypothetical protein
LALGARLAARETEGKLLRGLRLQGGHLDLYLHSRVGKSGGNLHGGGTDLAEILAQDWPTFREVAAVR